jgi:uncharacterized membrane protein
MAGIFKKTKMIIPALLAMLLLFLPSPVLNPGGILALIPVFYFFVKSPKYMNFFVSLFFIMVLDYNQDTIFIWTFLFILMYVAMSFQKVIILKEQEFSAALFFFVFVLAGLLTQWFGIIWPGNLGWADSFVLLLKALWTAVLSGALYIPASWFFMRFVDDR